MHSCKDNRNNHSLHSTRKYSIFGYWLLSHQNMRTLLAVLFLVAAFAASAQNTFVAVYKYYFPANVGKPAWELQRSHPDVQHFSSGDSIGRSPAFIKMQHEARKVIQNNQQFYGICSPVAMQFENRETGSVRTYLPDNTGVISKNIGNGYTIVDYSNWFAVFYRELRGIKDTICNIIDTSQLHFVKTGLKKKVGQWNCVAYKPALPGYGDITYWVCPSLKSYIHPGLYMGRGLDGGVVKVEFKKNKGSITLVSVTDTTAVIPVQPCPHTTPPEVYNPLEGGLRDY